MRFTGPVVTPVPRIVTEDIELSGQLLTRGDAVIVALTSANHDESTFTNAEDLEIVRHITRHIAFGYGIHICLGAPLARLEGDIAFTTLLRRMPNLRLAVPRETMNWYASLNVRGLTRLLVTF